jgi:hypothetical protein
MAQPPTPPSPTGVRYRPQSDLYTILLIIACAFLLGAVAFMIDRMLDLYGTVLPPPGG